MSASPIPKAKGAKPDDFTNLVPQTTMISPLVENLDRVRSRIGKICRKVGRDPSDVELVAISKTHPAEMIRQAVGAGQELFGESRAQEMLLKVPLLPGRLRWHFIGHLQSNKIRKVLPHCELIHGVDSEALARDIDRIAAEEGLHPRVLLEVNVSGEGSKHGFAPDLLERVLDDLLKLRRLQVDGFMTMAPLADQAEASRRHFANLRELRDRLAVRVGIPLATLSMGMSGDFEVAVEEGATLVRVGSAIFGAPQKRPPN
jgi:PLP dependent protein